MSFQIDPNKQPPGEGKRRVGSSVDLPQTGVEGSATSAKTTAGNNDEMWMQKARDAFNSSTSWFKNEHLKSIKDGVDAFNNKHPADSKYNAERYKKSSALYRPKTRALIQKNEASLAEAFFSNLDMVDIKPENAADAVATVGARVNQSLLQYRLTKSIDWFRFLVGGFQDTMKSKVAIAHVYWKKRIAESEDDPEDSEWLEDKPVCELIPVENFRFDPACNWMDPVGTSPYLIHIMPFYVMEVKAMMKSGEWFEQPIIATNRSDDLGSIRKGEDSQNASKNVTDYQQVFVMRHIHRIFKKGRPVDYEFYTLGDEQLLLTTPEPLKNNVLTGMRPYVVGVSNIETHTAIPSSLANLVAPLQAEANDVANSRLENVKLALNKTFFVKQGSNTDVATLLLNRPGKVVMTGNPLEDIKEAGVTDVTQSSYLEQDRINADIDEIGGNFSAGSVQTNRQLNETARGMAMLQRPANMMTEYKIRIFAETFVKPVLEQIIALEQHYETDPTLIALVGQQNAEQFQMYGLNAITDEMLKKKLTITLNVGINNTDPSQKLQRFANGVMLFANIAKSGIPGLNLQEVAKEVFSFSGYQDGTRFFTVDNPQVAQLQQQVQQLSQMLQQASVQIKDKKFAHEVKLAATQIQEKNKFDIAKMKEQHEDRRNLVTHVAGLVKVDKLDTTR